MHGLHYSFFKVSCLYSFGCYTAAAAAQAAVSHYAPLVFLWLLHYSGGGTGCTCGCEAK